MIYCLSQHHTGTWTSLSWLNSHRDVEGFIQRAHAHETLAGDLVVHKVESGEYRERFHPKMVYHEHLVRDPRSDMTRIDAAQMIMLATTPTLIPIRDPLASLVTYQEWADRDGRSSEVGTDLFSPRVFVDVWCCLAGSFETIKKFGHVRFVPWDLLGRAEMSDYLLGVEKDLGLKDHRPAKRWRRQRIVDNTSGHYRLKMAYQNWSPNLLRKGIAENGYNYLVNKGLQLRPFLEELGYRNLRWWS